MPFTFAHPLYIAPAKWIRPGYMSLAGLVLGSMAPDFEYFLAMEPYQRIGHTHAGLLQAFVLCTLLLFLLQVVLKPLALHLPSVFDLDLRVSALIRPFDFRRMRSWVVFIVSVAIGFYSHILIDGLTHASGFFVMRYPALRSVVVADLPVYKLLQHALSIFGLTLELAILLYVLANVPYSAVSAARVAGKRKRRYWITVAIMMIVVVCAKLLFTSSSNLLGILVVSPISGCFAGLVAAGALFGKAR